MRRAVSKKKKRFQKNGFDLDLAYVTPRVVAMGFPARDHEKAYRNSADEFETFVETYHGANRAKLYNLCSERAYPPTAFDGRFSRFPFDDHAPPPLGMFYFFCADVDHFLGGDAENVAFVHCKAGKGRTGVMIAAYLVWSGEHETAKDALEYYARRRTANAKGVTIPSQRRFVDYFARLLAEDLATPAAPKVSLSPSSAGDGALEERSTAGTTPPSSRDGTERGYPPERWTLPAAPSPRDPADPRPPRFDGASDEAPTPPPGTALVDGAWNAQNRLQARGRPGALPPPRKVQLRELRLKRCPRGFVWGRATARCGSSSHEAAVANFGETGVAFRFAECVVVDEVRVSVWRKTRTDSKQAFAFWFHTAFVGDALILRKADLDKACKDKKHEKFPADFEVEAVFGA